MITLKAVHLLGIELANKRGPRALKDIEIGIKNLKKGFDKLDEKKKKYFDMEEVVVLQLLRCRSERFCWRMNLRKWVKKLTRLSRIIPRGAA